MHGHTNVKKKIVEASTGFSCFRLQHIMALVITAAIAVCPLKQLFLLGTKRYMFRHKLCAVIKPSHIMCLDFIRGLEL